MKIKAFFLLAIAFQLSACAAPTQIEKAKAGAKESPQWWYQQGADKVQQLALQSPYPSKAKNIIIFIGDGMSISTITAARILQGQQHGGYGEENQLSFEKFPQTALSKTYNSNQQTPDSAGTMSAIMTGVKTKAGVIAVDGTVNLNDCDSGKNHQRMTLLEWAENNGMNTGIVTTARLTHATPAATYAHSVSRNWESDSDIPVEQREKGCTDIAAQLIEFPYGDGLEVAIGGGRENFISNKHPDPEYVKQRGSRSDNRNLMQEWQQKYKASAVVWNKQQFDALDVSNINHLLGLFEPSHMQYEYDRPHDGAGEPNLREMTQKALQLLKHKNKPFFLMIEAGRIDHAHHAGNAFRALSETIELSNAVDTALTQVDLNETLILVTADHSHTFNLAGYPERGNPILGVVKNTDKAGNLSGEVSKDAQGKSYTTLSYANGPGYVNGDQRPDLSHVDVQAADYKQAAVIPRISETHSGEDVVIYATGAGSQTVHGTIEQNVIYHIMKHALQKK
jgi:alkaline phosphatase